MVSDSTSNLKAPPGSAKKPLWQQLRVKIVLMIMVAGFGVWGFQFLNTASTNQPQGEILTQAVERKSFPLSITPNGTVNAERSINLSPKAQGLLKKLLVKESDRVRQGQVVAVMDDSSLIGQMTQMQGQLAQQEANLQR